MHLLRVRRHGPAGNDEDEARDEVALRVAVSITTKPDSHETSTPPNDAHCGVLPIVLHPFRSPSVFGKSIYATPGGNDTVVVKLL